MGKLVIGHKIYRYDEVGSTNDVAKGLALEGALEGTVVLAEYQTNGRGRLGRTWISPRGKNILLSVLLKPHLEPDSVFLITLMSSVALARTLASYGFDARIKWPNDILIAGKKAAGILTEMVSDEHQSQCFIVGIGINVNMTQEEIPRDLRDQVSSLGPIKNKTLDRNALIKGLLLSLDENYNLLKHKHYEKILEDWSTLSFLTGKWVRVFVRERILEGVALGIDRKGSLLLKMESGLIETVSSGDIELMEKLYVQ